MKSALLEVVREIPRTALRKPEEPTNPIAAAVHAGAGATWGVLKAGVRGDGVALQAALRDAKGVRVGLHELFGGDRFGVGFPYRTEISPGVFRGSRLDEEGAQGRLSGEALGETLSYLKKHKIRSLVDLRAERSHDAALAKAVGGKVFRAHVVDQWHPTMRGMREIVDFMKRPENQPVYVHCQAGAGRTGTVIACYRIAAENWPLDKALAEAQHYAQGNLQPNQVRFIQKWAEVLAKQTT